LTCCVPHVFAVLPAQKREGRRSNEQGSCSSQHSCHAISSHKRVQAGRTVSRETSYSRCSVHRACVARSCVLVTRGTFCQLAVALGGSIIDEMSTLQVKRHFAALHGHEKHLVGLASRGFAERYRPYLWMRIAGVEFSERGVTDLPARSSLSSDLGPFMLPSHKALFDASLSLKSDAYEEQTIKRDVDRTFPEHE